MLRKQSIILLLLITGCFAPGSDIYECQFESISGRYRTTHGELESGSTLILVTNSDGRQHMFRRELIFKCQAVELE